MVVDTDRKLGTDESIDINKLENGEWRVKGSSSLPFLINQIDMFLKSHSNYFKVELRDGTIIQRKGTAPKVFWDVFNNLRSLRGS